MTQIAGYDSASPPLTPFAWVAQLRANAGLIRLLVSKDLRIRYKRSLLGVWWSLLSPLMEMAVLAAVFSQVFRARTDDVPYVVYVLSGIVVAALMRNVILRTSASLSENAVTLSRMRVPAELFSIAVALEVGVNFLVSLIPLLALTLLSGASISWTAPLLLGPTVLTLLFGFGIGLALAPTVARFVDVLPLAGIVLGLVTYLAPVIYPFEIVPARYRFIVELNPLFRFVDLFRETLYGAGFGSGIDWLVALGYTLVALAVGGWLFARGRAVAIAVL